MPESTAAEADTQPETRCVLVCQYQSCLRHGSAAVLAAFEAQPVPGVKVEASSCQGQCNTGPTVRVTPDQIWYCRVKPSDVPLIVEQHLKGGKPVEALFNPRIHMRYYY
ncbi:MAG: (2Fe-2S) ferredoxin domain-containing protein [Microcoleus sp. PH2017_40_RAT_O_B]|uniref:(2Fe-2S) ferredoxin domain-containing protein n=1 Tax=unclassified Microcoleus TaxID=2642155 RepID=UPI001DF232B8|nr:MULTISPECIES: (2Fe-2S) ferredoxin domain-containing protein [unclassified Microcoleus]MCC3575056.1 (2Fe-2S) ferredoxin domain-containing protein [Microcoleus sp. PH2017_34_RAT_O_A]MCC3612667.1 (2Fe-2S) ferredoxin domain-containing protein [Microcoleus sp. PH2017_40_RAT_O_B]TAE13631.1 MAG: (2Fe-2S) ferredoxin domain-containing protein [Oscillatoriales cyanobacterium]TAE21695.1 MAG: (2Fe-2S) ferredoxin domain-containing protein [Oscillatoriales cyanobacterium]